MPILRVPWGSVNIPDTGNLQNWEITGTAGGKGDCGPEHHGDLP